MKIRTITELRRELGLSPRRFAHITALTRLTDYLPSDVIRLGSRPSWLSQLRRSEPEFMQLVAGLGRHARERRFMRMRGIRRRQRARPVRPAPSIRAPQPAVPEAVQRPSPIMPLFWRIGVIATIAAVVLAYLVQSPLLCIIAFFVLYGIYALFPVLEHLLRGKTERK